MRSAIHSTLPMMAVMCPVALGGTLLRSFCPALQLHVPPLLLHRHLHDHCYHLVGQVDFLLLLSSAAEHLQAQHHPAPP